MQRDKYSHFTSIEHATGEDSVLGSLMKRAASLLAHQETVRSALEPACRPHCWLANFRNGTLFLQSDSAAWGTRIRMQQRQLIQQLRTHPAFKQVKAVKVSIAPRAKAAKPRHRVQAISADNARQLEETANTTDDVRLRAALKKLAATARRGNSN